MDPAIVRPHKVHDPRFVALAAQASKRVYAGAQDAKRVSAFYCIDHDFVTRASINAVALHSCESQVAANRLDSARMSSPAEGLLSVTESQDDGMVVANEMWVQAVTMKAALIEIEGVIKRYHDMTDGQRGYSHWPFAGPKPSQ